MNGDSRLIIFDLDGTLLDTSSGIFGSVRFAEKQMGLSPIKESLLPQFIGPPPKDMYMKLYGLSEKEALSAVMFHREYGLDKAIYEAYPYEGIPETLIVLCEKGYSLAVATLKKQSIAEKILQHFDLKRYFESIVGMNEKETFSKQDTIEYAVRNVNAVEAVMVGDSAYDYYGARNAGVDFVGVSYGFGFSESKKYRFPVAKTPYELIELI